MRREHRGIDRSRNAVLATFMLLTPALNVPRFPDSTFVASMRAGDLAFRAFDNAAAQAAYERAFAADSLDCDVLWKLARAYLDRGEIEKKDEKGPWLAAGERLARRCVALYPDSSEAHFYLAVAVGELADHVGGKRRIELSREVKKEAEAALALRPDHYGAMHILGRWNYSIASLGWIQRTAAKIIYGGVPPGASHAQAREWFERAMAIRPEAPLNHLWLGETLIKLGDYRRARAELQACLDLDDVFWDDYLNKARARQRLHDIEGKP